MDPKKDPQRSTDEEGVPEEETQNPKREGVENTPQARTDLEQDEKGDTAPGD